MFPGFPFKAGDKYDVMSLRNDCTLNAGSPIKPYFIIDTVEIAGFFKTTAEVNISHLSMSMLKSKKPGLSIMMIRHNGRLVPGISIKLHRIDADTHAF